MPASGWVSDSEPASRSARLPVLHGFAPLAAPDAACLVLGSMPGSASLAAGQYYAHPRNAFWPLLSALLALPPALPYEARCQALLRHRIAVWDVLAACNRSGSLDTAIVPDSVVPNDFTGFFAAHPAIRAIFFNGTAAATLYRRHVLPTLPVACATLPRTLLPSTSPAHAALDFAAKLERWRQLPTASSGTT